VYIVKLLPVFSYCFLNDFLHEEYQTMFVCCLFDGV